MPTAAQLAANIANAQASSGPRTAEGKATSSQNATTYGLFATSDFIRPGEEDTYAQLNASLESDLAPSGMLEYNLVGEIRRAMWRLSRCGDVEAGFIASLTTGSDAIPDPIQNEATAKLQNSVDRARAQAHRLLHRCTSELRRLQTERQYRNEIFEAGTDLSHLGIADYRAAMKGLSEHRLDDLRRRKVDGLDDFVSILETTHKMVARPAVPTEMPITERSQSAAPQFAEIARNAPCPCHSGEKYKRCCGRNAPAMRTAA